MKKQFVRSGILMLFSLLALPVYAGAPLYAVRINVREALDVLRTLASQVAFDLSLAVDDLAQADDLFLGEVAHFGVGVDAQLSQDAVGRRAPSAPNPTS
jgi:hypothetical protein